MALGTGGTLSARELADADQAVEFYGEHQAGLFFISFQRDPGKQFVPLQRRLGQNDRLTEYIQHTSSAVFACPPGIRRDGYVGEKLFS